MTTRNLLVLGGLLLLLLAMPALAGAAEPADVRAAATCSNHPNQAAAQRAADTRDTDGDGVYCESLPCPCAKPGQGSPRKRTPARRPKAKPKPRKVAQVFAARVVSVIDGDTVKVRYGSTRATVRIIGIDTPETKRPGVGIECGGPESSASMKLLAPVGARVTLRTDPTQDTRDRYRRLLAYVGRGGRDLGRTQVSRGWAETYVYGGKPFQRTASYRRSQAKAKRSNVGVYGRCGGDFHSEQSVAGSAAVGRRCSDFRATNPFGTVASFGARAAGMSCSKVRSVLAAFWRRDDEAEVGTTLRVGCFVCKYLRYFEPGRAAFRCRLRSNYRVAAAALWKESE